MAIIWIKLKQKTKDRPAECDLRNSMFLKRELWVGLCLYWMANLVLYKKMTIKSLNHLQYVKLHILKGSLLAFVLTFSNLLGYF